VNNIRAVKATIPIKRSIKDLTEYLDREDVRGLYDKMLDFSERKRKVCEDVYIGYAQYKGKFLFEPRDFVLCGMKVEKPNVMYSLVTGIDLPHIPPKKGVTRSECFIGGFYLEKLSEELTQVTYYSHADTKLNASFLKISQGDVVKCVVHLKELMEKK